MARWHAKLNNWHTFGTLVRLFVRWRVGTLQREIETLLTHGHVDHVGTYGTHGTRFSKLISASTVSNPRLSNTCVFEHVSFEHVCFAIPFADNGSSLYPYIRNTMKLFFDLNIQKHKNGIDTMIPRILRFECVSKVWTLILLGFLHEENWKSVLSFFYISCIVMVENRRNCFKKNSDNNNNTNDCVSNISIYFWLKNKIIV